MRSATDLAGDPRHACRMERTFSSRSWAGSCSMIAWRFSGSISCSARPTTPPFARRRILPSRTNVPLLAHAGEQAFAFRGLNERVSQATRLLTKQGLTEQVGEIAVSGARRDDAVDRRMAFILEKLV